jgi:hypothetical protein
MASSPDRAERISTPGNNPSANLTIKMQKIINFSNQSKF